MADQTQDLLRECLASGQMSAAQAVQHFEAGDLDVSPTMTPHTEIAGLKADAVSVHEAASTSGVPAASPLPSLPQSGRSELPRGIE